MTSFVADYYIKSVLDTLFGKQTLVTIPTTLYCGLVATAPTATNGGGLVETTGGGYARVAVPNDLANWPAATVVSLDRIKANANAIQFPAATGSWGTVVGVALFDALTTGNLVAYGDIPQQDIVVGNIPTVAAGNFKIKV